MKFRIAAVAATSLALAACGSTDDASTEAKADTVEVSADEAMTDVAEEPVADPAATATAGTTAPAAGETAAPATSEATQVQEAGDKAAETAAAAADAMAEETR